VIPIRLTVVLTHPIQYYSPWFRHIAAGAPELDLTVVYATEPTPEQQGVGFGRAFTWDVPLTEGYKSIVVRPAKADDRVDSSHFRGLDVPEIGAAIAAGKPDVVLITGWYSITLVRALHACRRLGVPALYRGDSHLLSGPRGWRRLAWALKTRYLLRRFEGYLSPGRRVNEYLHRFGVPDYRVFEVPHAVDNEMFRMTAAPYQEPGRRAAARREWSIDPGTFVVLFVGKLVPSKRPLNVVRALARLKGSRSLVVVGSGPLEETLRKEAQRLDVDLHMTGFLNQTELGRAYALADCLALPSDFPETWGLVVNEALATGLPVVVSAAVGCAPDLVRDGETGYIYPLDDIEALSRRLEMVRQRKAEQYDWSTACRSKVAAHSYAAMTSGLVRACRSVLRHSPGAEADWNVSPRRILACCGQMVVAGGLERMTFEVLRAMHRRGAATHCIVNSWENFRITPLAEAAGASWSTGPYWFPLTRRRLTPRTIVRMIREVTAVSRHLLREARRIHPTHVLLPDFQTLLRNVPALVALRMRGVRVVARLGNAPDPGPFYRRLWRWGIAPFADVFVCNSSFTERELRAHGVHGVGIVTIPNTAPPRSQEWKTEGERIPGRVIFVGQVIPEKGLDLLLDAIARLRASGHDVTLDVVGEMDGWEAESNRGYRRAQRDRAARADLNGSVAFLGWREDVPALMARASLHCIPSRPEQREAFGNVVLEAKLSGLPSVVGPSGDLPELVVHRETGWVCQHATADALAEGIAFFLEDAERLRASGRAALASAAAFNPERFGEAWSRVFETDGDWHQHERLAV
jgi:glycosyltransferase involved in cell wall biosynthesis